MKNQQFDNPSAQTSSSSKYKTPAQIISQDQQNSTATPLTTASSDKNFLLTKLNQAKSITDADGTSDRDYLKPCQKKLSLDNCNEEFDVFHQYCNKVFMIEPTAFKTNEGAIVDNSFMKRLQSVDSQTIQSMALKQWKEYRSKLQDAGVDVVSFKQHRDDAPDAVWPDWFTTLKCKDIPDGVSILYPMNSKQRQNQRQQAIDQYLIENYKHRIDLTYFEEKGIALEGKGAVVFDVRNMKVYCSLSPRCSYQVIQALVHELNNISARPLWKAVVFKSYDQSGSTIYHTDCMLTLYEHHAVCCLDSIKDAELKELLISQLTDQSLNISQPYEILEISHEQIGHMVCNGFNLRDSDGQNVITMSLRAHSGIKEKNIQILKQYYKIVVVDIKMLEDIGGGSTRCLLAEHF